MAANWQSVFQALPSNLEVVYVRVLDYYGEPVLAQFRTATEDFISQGTSVVFPIWQVARWRSQ